ncbi:uncharacterized protein LOC141841435 [Curcuma longa]|uniref:uncharacterized protein LOC141841435 n=1 Tax=Curcuma longa TaxID=136217 RepID=UPI003D9E117C
MASRIARFLRSLAPPTSIQPSVSSGSAAHRFLTTAAAASDASANGGDASAAAEDKDDKIFLKSPNSASTRDKSSVTMPMSFMTGSIVGKRFYKEVTTRMADDGNGWTVMLDYRTLKTPCKKPLKLRSLALAKAIAAEWEYQEKDGIRPFTMPLMKLTCTALERVPLTRATIIENLMNKFHLDLVFCRSPGDNDVTIRILKKQEENLDPILDWLQSKFGFKPAVYSSLFGGKQDEGLAIAIKDVLKGTNDFELAAIDALAANAHSIVIPLAIFFGRIGIEEAIKLIRLEEDQQIDRWGLVEGGHDVDIADLKVQISSAAVLLGLSK